MNQSPLGVVAKAFLHGFAALYAIILAGCLFIFAMSFLLSDDTLRDALLLGSIVCFFIFSIAAIILRCVKENIFSVKEEYQLTIRTEGSKTLDGKIVSDITQLMTPIPPHIPEREDERGEEK